MVKYMSKYNIEYLSTQSKSDIIKLLLDEEEHRYYLEKLVLRQLDDSIIVLKNSESIKNKTDLILSNKNLKSIREKQFKDNVKWWKTYD